MENKRTMTVAENTAVEPADLVRAGVYATSSLAAEHGLVVLAMGSSYWLEESPEGYGVLVEPAQFPSVQREFAIYDETSRNWPPRMPTLVGNERRVAMPWLTPLLWAALVSRIFWAQFRAPGNLIEAGALHGAAVWHDGEWWRLVTALFLHGDLLHLLGNMSIGALVFTQLVATRGTVRAWLELAVASVAANAANALVRLQDGSPSLGASTAVFAAIGLLTGGAVRVGWRTPRLIRWRAVGVPLGAGLVLLGLLGAGDSRTDVIAHAFGFVAGVVVGAGRPAQDVASVGPHAFVRGT